MRSGNLNTVGERLVKRFGTRDPFVIADGLGIVINECSNLRNMKGMYSILQRTRFIFLNDQLDEDMRRIVCAHEIGHDQLHRHLVKNGALKEFTLFDMQSVPEYEANMVCAGILLDTDEFLSLVYEKHYCAEEIAHAMRTDINLVALKAAQLKSLGYDLREQDFKSNFLK